MLRSESESATDWRGWLALVWVVAFGLLYGRTVVEHRGVKFREAVAGVASRLGHTLPGSIHASE